MTKDISYEELSRKFNLKEFPVALGERPLHTVWRFSLSIPAEDLWPYIADTSRFNRSLGMARRQEKEVDGKNHVSTTVLGFSQEWIEEPWTWFHGRALESVRVYKKGMAKRVRANFFLEPTAEGVDFYVNFSWMPKNSFWFYFLKVTSPILRGNFSKVLSKITSFARSKNKQKPEALKIANDPTKNVNLIELVKIHEKLKETGLDQKALDALIDFIKIGDNMDLFRLKALVLARSLGVPKKEILKVCMESVRQGLLSISWDVICPHCRGVRFSAQNLGQIPANSECLVCEVDFQTDTFDSIEVIFQVHPTYRKVEEILFCAAEPAKKDHIQVQDQLLPGQQLVFTQKFKEGRHRLRVSNPTANYHFEIKKNAPEMIIHWNLEGEPEKIVCGPDPSFQIENTTDRVRKISIEQLWWVDNILHPADIFVMNEYRDVFSKDSLEANVKISLGVQVMMFTDIVNSTTFYNQKGDAAAFNDVKKHFLEVFDIVKKHDGSVIKTIGDSVMASFADAKKALLAATDIQKIFHSGRQDTTIRLRISLHIGQVIAVHLLQGLDLFGATVNKAAKLQACAGTGEVACSMEFFKTLDLEASKRLQPFTEKRQSSFMYKESLLEAHVIKCHQMS